MEKKAIYELHIPQGLPQLRTLPTGKRIFNKGCTPINKGKTYEEAYGENTAKAMKQKQTQKRMGHPNYAKKLINSKAVVVIIDGRLAGRYSSGRIPAEKAGVSVSAISAYIKRKRHPANDWLWFHESDDSWINIISK